MPVVLRNDFPEQGTPSINNRLYGLRVAKNQGFEPASGPIFSVIPLEYDSLTKHVLDSFQLSNDALGKLHWRAMPAHLCALGVGEGMRVRVTP